MPLDKPAAARQFERMRLPERDALAISGFILAAVLTAWLGIAGPVLNIDPKTLNDTAGLAAWAQALLSGVAIVAVYIAATIPVRAERKRRENELRLQRQGLAFLLIPEVLALLGEVQTAIGSGTIYDAPIRPPESLSEKLGELYILREVGGRLLQTVGIIRGLAAQTLRFQAKEMINGVPQRGRVESGRRIWENHKRLLKVCRDNLREAANQLKQIVEP